MHPRWIKVLPNVLGWICIWLPVVTNKDKYDG